MNSITRSHDGADKYSYQIIKNSFNQHCINFKCKDNFLLLKASYKINKLISLKGKSNQSATVLLVKIP